MRKIVMMVLAAMAAVGVSAQQKWHYDSTKVERLSEVVVSGVRAQKNAPYAVSNLKRQELAQFATSGQEMPLLFSRTPGVLAWSEKMVYRAILYIRSRTSPRIWRRNSATRS